MRKFVVALFGVIFFSEMAFADVSTSAILAWKFPVMNGIVCEGDNIAKWNVPSHPELPTSAEIDIWKTEYTAFSKKQQAGEELQQLGVMLKALSPESQAELIAALKAKAQQEGVR